ncbi:MAG: sugar MFS transporter [Bacteroidetes bacterium]|nr:sugar MFS transporter [Bacteroidota bacterium]
MNRIPLLGKDNQGKSYLFPFILITSLFFLWGFAHSLLDVLNKHFQDILHVTKAQSGLVQAAVYGGYFLMAIPAGMFMKRFGYKKGIILGLLLYAFGAFLFYPATHIQTFWAFLLALFIIALGLTCLETAANPYSSVMGPPSRAEQRLTLSQSFNGMGWIFGPMAGSLLIFATTGGSNKFASLAIPYIGVGFVVLLIALLFWRTKLPEITESGDGSAASGAEELSIFQQYKALLRYRHFILAVIAQFFYVAAQTGINSFFINYTTDIFQLASADKTLGSGMINTIVGWVASSNPGITESRVLFNTAAGILLSLAGMGLFMAGRFLGSLFMTWFNPRKLLRMYAIVCVLLMIMVITGAGFPAILSLCLSYFFMSIMFPSIFALGLKNLGVHTKRASSFLVMAIVGGAICPYFMGRIADNFSMKTGFTVPLICFAFIVFYTFRANI